MTGTHSCPRCELRFAVEAEVIDHLRRDHGVELGSSPATEEQPATTGRIVVPVDPFREPTMAARAAGVIARQTGLAVQIVAVRPAGLPAASVDAFLFHRCKEAEEAGAPEASWADLGSGDPADAVCEVLTEDDVALVCLATRARSAVGKFVIGSVATQILNRSTVPVVLVGPNVVDVPQRYRQLLVALDGSELAEQAGRVAESVAMQADSELFLIEVLGDEPAPPDVAETAYLARIAAGMEPKPGRYDALRSEHPGRAILDMASDADDVMVVMGTHGRTGLTRLVLGSVAHDVVHGARAPVIVVPQTASVWEWPAARV